MKKNQIIQGSRHPAKRIYISLLLWIVGRAIQAAGRISPAVQKECRRLPDDFSFALKVLPRGPSMTIVKQDDTLHYLRKGLKDNNPELLMGIKTIDSAFRIFTFRESTAEAAARDRLITDGPIPFACTMVRILDSIEILLLPRILAKRAVKRYKSPKHKYVQRFRIYTRVFINP